MDIERRVLRLGLWFGFGVEGFGLGCMGCDAMCVAAVGLVRRVQGIHFACVCVEGFAKEEPPACLLMRGQLILARANPDKPAETSAGTHREHNKYSHRHGLGDALPASPAVCAGACVTPWCTGGSQTLSTARALPPAKRSAA